MTVLYILLALILLLGIALCLPLKVEIKFENNFFIKVEFLKFTLYPKKKKTMKKSQNPQKPSTQSAEPKEKNLFEKLVDKKGFKGAISELFTFFKAVISPLGKFLKKLKFRKIDVRLSVVGSDAAATAIDYGIVCSVVYPVLSVFESIANAKYKRIDIRSDFEGKKSSFGFSLCVKASVIFILVFGYKIFKEYKNFCVRNDLQ